LRLLLALVLVLAACASRPVAACPNVPNNVTPSPVLATACPFEQSEQPASNGYTLHAPDPNAAPGWVELALPSGRWLVHSGDCVLDPGVMVWYHSSAPNLAGVNDCPLDAWIALSDVPCDMDPQTGVCDITADPAYQDWLLDHP